MNAFGFAAGDPVSFSDPFGLCTWKWLCDLKDDANAGFHAELRNMGLETGQAIIGDGRAFALGQFAAHLMPTLGTARVFPAARAMGSALAAESAVEIGTTDSQILSRASAIFKGGEGAGVLPENQRLWAALDQAAGEVVPGAKASQIGTLGDAPVIGSARSGIGVARVGEQTFVVRRLSPNSWEVLRNF